MAVNHIPGNGGSKMAATAKILCFLSGPTSDICIHMMVYYCEKFHACT